MPQENSDWKILLDKVLQLEGATNCQDQAVTGGLEAFVARQRQALAHYVAGYASAPHDERVRMLESLRVALDGLQAPATAATAIPEPSPLPESPGLPLDAPITSAAGVAAKRAGVLAKLGIETVEDLMLYFPFRLEDRTTFSEIGSAQVGEDACIRGEVLTVNTIRARGRMTIVKAAIGDGTGFLFAVFFNQPWIAKQLKKGMRVDVFGRVERTRNELQMRAPVWEPEGTGLEIGRWVPVYPATEGITARNLRSILSRNLDPALSSIQEILPEPVRTRHGLLARRAAIETVHRPQGRESFEAARRSLAFEELFLLQVGLASTARAEAGRIHAPVDGWMDSFIAGLPFKLTRAQRAAIDEIVADLKRPIRMMRLLQGDVGSGKTLVALAAALYAMDGRCQVAYMAPTEILAAQHAETFKHMLEGLPIRVELLTSSTPDKETLREAAEAGEIQLLVGTHALIQESVEFKNLGLVIIDEQHRFGVIQRSQIEEKGDKVDVLVMSATPIPRTITLTLYGEFDVSTLDEMPSGTRAIRTQWFEQAQRGVVYEEVARLLADGKKGFVVLPLVEESEKVAAKAATQVAEELRPRFSDAGVGLIHGRLASQDKTAAMEAFRLGEVRLLVATTVIEVGIDIQDADFMVIEHADRFGLSQLHQLRGRIGRAGQDAICFALSDARTDEAVQRMTAFSSFEDGFSIAEADLKIRGPGDLVGTQQHGFFTELRAVNLIEDLDLMYQARDAAKMLVAEGVPKTLNARVHRRFGELLKWMRV